MWLSLWLTEKIVFSQSSSLLPHAPSCPKVSLMPYAHLCTGWPCFFFQKSCCQSFFSSHLMFNMPEVHQFSRPSFKIQFYLMFKCCIMGVFFFFFIFLITGTLKLAKEGDGYLNLIKTCFMMRQVGIIASWMHQLTVILKTPIQWLYQLPLQWHECSAYQSFTKLSHDYARFHSFHMNVQITRHYHDFSFPWMIYLSVLTRECNTHQS